MSDSTSRTDLYRFFDVHDVLLYIGISLNAAQRASQHRADKHWWPEVHRMEVEHLDCDRGAAIIIERNAILAEMPLYNVTHNTPIMATTTPGDGPVSFNALAALSVNDGTRVPLDRFDVVWKLHAVAKAMDDLAHCLDRFDHDRDDDEQRSTRADFLATLDAIARSIVYGNCCHFVDCVEGGCEPMYPLVIDIRDDTAKCLYICPHCTNVSSCSWTLDLALLASIG